jgi:hypothetical protein
LNSSSPFAICETPASTFSNLPNCSSIFRLKITTYLTVLGMLEKALKTGQHMVMTQHNCHGDTMLGCVSNSSFFLSYNSLISHPSPHSMNPRAGTAQE